MTVSSSARYSQVLHMVFNYMFLEACVSNCKIFPSFTLGFLFHAPSGLCLQVQDIHKFYTWFLSTCSFRPASPSARYSQVVHIVFYYMLKTNDQKKFQRRYKTSPQCFAIRQCSKNNLSQCAKIPDNLSKP